MKKLPLFIALILAFSLLLSSAASADVVTALATEVNPEHLEKTASYARILGCDAVDGTLTVELIVPEVFRRDEVLALRAGDRIYTGGQEIVIQKMERFYNDSLIIINEGEYEYAEGSVYLYEDLSGNYRPEVYDDYTWVSLSIMRCPMQETLLFLDGIDPNTGDARTLPAVYTAQELKAQLLSQQESEDESIGLANNNVYVVFDGEGNLAAVHRFYVPWQ